MGQPEHEANEHLFGIKKLQFGSTDSGRYPESVAVCRAEARDSYEERKGNQYMSGRKEKQFWSAHYAGWSFWTEWPWPF